MYVQRAGAQAIANDGQTCSSTTKERPSTYARVCTSTARTGLIVPQVGAFLESISPYTFASVGIALCIGLSVVGSAWYVSRLDFCTHAI